MLWREPYRPRVEIDIVVPELTGNASVILGAFDLRAQRELGVWQRLLHEADLTKEYRLLLISSPDAPISRGDAESAFPPSLHSRVDLVADRGRAWRSLVAPDCPERAFAAILAGRLARVLVVGSPTEEVWESFCEVASAMRRSE